MRFVYPQFLWALLLLAIPIIIHLYNFRRYKTLYFSSLQFLKKVDTETKSAKNIKHLLVLIARMLFIIFAVFAFAQPYIPKDGNAQKIGHPVLAIYLDNSFSMDQQGAEGSLFSEAKESAKRIIDKSDKDTRFLFVSNELSGVEQRMVSRIEASDRIDNLKLSGIVKNIDEILNFQRNFITQYDKEQEPVNRIQYVILSDFQKASFSTSKLSRDSSSLYYPIQFTAQNSINLSVDSIWFDQPFVRPGQTQQLNIQVKNHGINDVVNGEIHIEIGEQKRDVFIDIPAKQKVQTKLSFLDKENDNTFKTGIVSISDKQIHFDDDFYFSYLAKNECKVLIINGQDAVENIGDVYSLDNYFNFKQSDQNAIANSDIEEAELIVLNGLNQITSGLSSQLKNFSKNKGTVLIFPGTDIDFNQYNSLLANIQLPNLQGTSENGLKISSIEYKDKYFTPVFEKKPTTLNIQLVNKMYGNSGNSSKGIALLNTQNGQGLFYRSLDSKSYLFTSSLSEEFGSFTKNALFSTLLLRTGELSSRPTPFYLILGNEKLYPVYGKQDLSDKPLRLVTENFDFIPNKIVQNSNTFISISGQEAIEKLNAGIYSIKDDKELAKLAINYNRRESNIECFTVQEIENQLSSAGILNVSSSVINQGQSLSKLDLVKPFQYWRWMISLSLLFLLSEMVILRFFKN